MLSEPQKGVVAIVCACIIWGLSGIYFHAIAHIPPLEILAHRAIWSFVFFLILLAFQRRLTEWAKVMCDVRSLGILAFAAVVVSTNWFVYIVAVQRGYAAEASLGYYIFPLASVVLGYVVFRERFSRVQKIAVGLAVLAVLALSIGLGVLPWIALILATTFSVYGLIKKKISVGPVLSVAVEITLLLPLAIAWLVYVHMGQGGAFGVTLGDSAMLIGLAGFTGLPLVLFSYGYRRLPFSTVGLVQYLNPSLQLIVAVSILGESLQAPHALALPLIWAGLILYSFDALRQDRQARMRGIKSSTDDTTSK